MTKFSLEESLPAIHSAGNLIFDPVWSEKKHISGFCELIHIISGRVNVIMNRQRISAKSGDTVIIPSKTPHRDDFDISTGLEVFMINFSWSCEEDYFSRFSCSSLPKMSEPLKESIANLVQHFRHEFINRDSHHTFIARVHMAEILMKILASLAEKKKLLHAGEIPRTDYGKQRRTWILDRAREYLEKNYQNPVTLDEIAKELGVSPYHLSHIFSHESDFSLFEYLTSIRMKMAHKLLEEGRRSISEIAYETGFRNSNYFSKVFHRYFGLPPNQVYKQKITSRRA